jgi:hypothetical protein
VSARAAVVACALALLALPAAALADPGHSPDRPHLDAQTVAESGSGGSGIVIGITLATLVLLAVCGVVLKRVTNR